MPKKVVAGSVVTSVSIVRYLAMNYQYFKLKVIDVVTSILLPTHKVFFSWTSSSNATYCRSVGKGQYRIVFGGGTFRYALGLPEKGSISRKDAKKQFESVNKLFRALYYHEMGHLIYTDMSCDLITKYKPIYQNGLHSLFNILEDIYLENRGLRIDYPYTGRYLDFLVSKVFDDTKLAGYSDKGNASSFFNFLLYKLRRGKDFTGVNKFFEDHRDEMLAHIKDCLDTKNPTRRIERIITFFEWLVALKEIDFSIVPEPESKVPFSGDGSSGRPGSGKGSAEGAMGGLTGGKPGSPGRGDGKSGGSSKSGASVEDSLEDKDESKEKPDMSSDVDDDVVMDDSLDSPEDIIDSGADPVIDDEEVLDSTFEVLGSSELTHVFYNVRNEVEIVKDPLPQLERYIEEVSRITTDVITAIKAFKFRSRPKYVPGYSSGRLHVPYAIQGKPINFYKRKVGKALNNDLAISILCDNSGSMGGEKSYITTKALLALSIACTKLGIPFEVNGFTSSSDSSNAEVVTLGIKSFSELFRNTKEYFGILSGHTVSCFKSELPFFSGNKDEINLNYVGNQFLKTRYQQKIMIVISDGQTTGSTADLKNVVSSLEAQGVYVIGLGILDSSVSRAYQHFKIFPNTASLMHLAEFLTQMLFEFAKGER